jgi:uncharacterized membrane protein
LGDGPATGFVPHALLWSGTAASAVDLTPVGFSATEALGVAGGQQVGEGVGPATGGENHALLWSGTAASVVDLHAFLPPGFRSSQALGIDSSGNIVGTAVDSSGVEHPFLWTPCEESDHERECEREKTVADPATFFLVGSGLVGLVGTAAFRKRRESLARRHRSAPTASALTPQYNAVQNAALQSLGNYANPTDPARPPA